MIKEHERVVLKVPVPDHGLEKGDVGTIVHVYKDGQAYEVEFVTLDGKTAAVGYVGSRASAAGGRPRDYTRTRTRSQITAR